MHGQQVGYTRVSTIDQNTVRQLDGVTLDRVFEDKASGKDTNRPQLDSCLSHLREGDTLNVHSIDRLARNLADLSKLVDQLTARGVAVKFHNECLTFTGDDSPSNKLMLQMMGAFAEFERSMIRSRQAEGIAAAQNKGTRFGAKPKLTTVQIEQIAARVSNGEFIKTLADEHGVSRQTLHTALKRLAA